MRGCELFKVGGIRPDIIQEQSLRHGKVCHALCRVVHGRRLHRGAGQL